MANEITAKMILTDKEISNLFSLLNRYKGNRDSLILRLILFTGARGCEALKVRPVDLVDNKVTIFGAKRSRNRSISIPKDFFDELKEFCKDMNPDKEIFSIKTRRLRQIWNDWRPNKEKGVHSIRHSVAVKLYESSENIVGVASILGHKKIENTMKYLTYVDTKRMGKHLTNMWDQKVS